MFPKEELVYILIAVDILPHCRKNSGCIEFKKDPKTLSGKREKQTLSHELRKGISI